MPVRLERIDDIFVVKCLIHYNCMNSWIAKCTIRYKKGISDL